MTILRSDWTRAGAVCWAVCWAGWDATAQAPRLSDATPSGSPAAPVGASPPGPEVKPVLAMSPAVACVRVEGLDQYTPLPDATLTNADKLKVYFRPLHYKIETDPTRKALYHVKFTEDGRIRRKGDKTALAKEDKLLEYETRYEAPGYQVYFVNTIGLESLSPGEYEFDITLHDLIDGQATARQSLSFRIVPVAGEVATRPPAEPATPPPPAPKKTARPGRSARRPG